MPCHQALQEQLLIFPAVGGRGVLIEAPVPDDDVAGPVIALGNNPLKILIVEGMIFHLHGQPFLGRVQGRPLGHRPALQDAGHFEPEVVVQMPGRVLVHHKYQMLLLRMEQRRRLGRRLELPFFPVFLQVRISQERYLQNRSSGGQAPAGRRSPRAFRLLNHLIQNNICRILVAINVSSSIIGNQVVLCVSARSMRRSGISQMRATRT